MKAIRDAQKKLRVARASAQAPPWTGFLNFSEYLRAGEWVSVSPKVWHHVDATLPTVLTAPGGIASSWSRRFSWSSRWHWAKGRAINIVALWHRNPQSRVVVHHARMQLADAVAVTRANPASGRSSAVLFEPAAGRVLRIAERHPYDQEYLEVRKRFQRHMPAPDFSVIDGGRVLTEELRPGRVLKGEPVERQLLVALAILRAYEKLVHIEGSYEQESSWSELPKLLDGFFRRECVSLKNVYAHVRPLICSGLLVPTQGDFSTGNFLVESDSESWTVVDFDGAAWLPFWWDPITLVVKLLQSMGTRGTQIGALERLSGAFEHILRPTGIALPGGLNSQQAAFLKAVAQAWSLGTKTSSVPSHNGKFSPEPKVFSEHLVGQLSYWSKKLSVGR